MSRRLLRQALGGQDDRPTAPLKAKRVAAHQQPKRPVGRPAPRAVAANPAIRPKGAAPLGFPSARGATTRRPWTPRRQATLASLRGAAPTADGSFASATGVPLAAALARRAATTAAKLEVAKFQRLVAWKGGAAATNVAAKVRAQNLGATLAPQGAHPMEGRLKASLLVVEQADQ